MAKVDIASVAEALKDLKATPELTRAVIEKLKAKKPEQEEKEPRAKKQFLVLLSDPEGKYPAGQMVAWVLQLPEDAEPASVKDRLSQGFLLLRNSPRGRRKVKKLETLADFIEAAPGKVLKEQCGVEIKTKLPVEVVPISNRLPDSPPPQAE